jgi:sacsin
MKEELITVITKYLKAKTPRQKQKVLERCNIELHCSSYDANFKIELGKELPKCYYHRLDVDPYNIFSPMEYVGYEEVDGCEIIVVQVLYLVRTSNDHEQLTARYHVSTHREDQEGKDVSILDLYKFIIGTTKAQTQSLVLYDGDASRPLNESECAEIKESIREALKEIWKLDRMLRKKAVRRLYLKWHPDKNLDDTERAEEIFQFLKSEIDRLERSRERVSSNVPKASSSFDYRTWDHMASRQRTASVLEEEYMRDHQASSHPRPFEQEQRRPDPEEGRRWVKQAETDYRVLCDIHSKASTSNGYGHVCFMAHQVVEKALKGGVYALCGMDGRGKSGHNLTRHAYALQSVHPEQMRGLELHTTPLENYYLDTRYPNRWPGYINTPSDNYHSAHADEANYHAKTVLNEYVKHIMP